MTTIVELLAERAAATPQRLAVGTADGRTLTYAEWAERSTAAAAGLEAHVARGARVALDFSLATWVDFAVAFMAVAKAGGVCLPLPAGLSDARRAQLLQDVGAALVLADAAAANGADPPSLTLETLASGGATEAPRRPPTPAEPAEILLTSGTTGAPKPIVATHGNLAHHLLGRSGRELPPLCHAAAFASNAAQTLLVTPLAASARTVVTAPLVDAPVLASLIERFGVRELSAAPAVLLALASDERHDLSAIERVNVISAPIAAAGLRRVAERFPHAAIVNVYTSTEAWPARTTLHLGDGPDGSVGRPRGGSEVTILGEDGAPAPAGAIGEIALHLPAGASPRAALGGTTGGRAVRTGDVGYLDERGYLHIVDREGDVINVGGVKIYSVALEAELAQLPQVVEAAVVGAPHRTLGQYAVAAVVLAPGADVAQVRAQIEQRVGPRHAPQDVMAVATLPRTAADKVDKRALRALVGRGTAADGARPAPASGLEARVIELWERVLELDGVGRDDNFFALGGNSLLAMRLVTRLGEELDVELPASTYFDWATAAEMTAVVREELRRNGSTEPE